MTDNELIFSSPDQEKMHNLLKETDELAQKGYLEYLDAMRAIDPYRNVPINDDNVKEINTILFKIQERFNAIFPYLNSAVVRASNNQKIIDEYTSFMKQIEATEPQRVTVEHELTA